MFVVLVSQSCPTLGDPTDCSIPGASVQEIFSGKDTGVGFHFLLQPPPMGPCQIEGQRRLLQRDHTLDPLLGRKSPSPLSPLSPSPAPRLLWGSVGPPAPPPADSSTSAAGIFERTFPHPLPRLLKTPDGFPLGPAVLRTLGWASPRPLGLRPLAHSTAQPPTFTPPAPRHPRPTSPRVTHRRSPGPQISLGHEFLGSVASGEVPGEVGAVNPARVSEGTLLTGVWRAEQLQGGSSRQMASVTLAVALSVLV